VLQGAQGMTTDAAGNLYVIDGYTNIGYKFSPTGTQMLTFSYLGSGIGAGICVDPNNGNIIVPADNNTANSLGMYGAGYVLIFSSTGSLVNIIGQSISYPWTCAVLNNSMIVVDSANEPGAIYFLNPTTGASTSFGDAALGQSFETLGMAVANDGRIFVAALNLGIYVFTSTGQYIDVLSSPQEDIYCYGMAFTTAGGGTLYVADVFNQRVVTFNVGSSGTGPARGGGSSGSSHTVSSLATNAVITVAALLFTLFVSV